MSGEEKRAAGDAPADKEFPPAAAGKDTTLPAHAAAPAQTPSHDRSVEVAEALGVTLEEARALIAAGAMDAWESWGEDVGHATPMPAYSTPTRHSSERNRSCEGRFVRTPHPDNGWHSGVIARAATGSGGGLEWVNDAGARWGLALREGASSGGGDVLVTGPTNPYLVEVSDCVGIPRAV
jgi:hypothetical protein